ncbi:MAG: glycosyltransferase family 2 protein [Hyphomicrobiaceae bacterium]
MDMPSPLGPASRDVHDFIVDEPGPAMPPPIKRKLSIVVPLLNEERGLPILERRLTRALDELGHPWEVVIVDDGSTDGTLAAIKALNQRDDRYKAVSLSRNFGKEIAVAAGLKQTTGEGVVIMDGDLQHPPEAIAELVARWNEGYDIVYGRRRSRETDSAVIRTSSRMFYRVFHFLSGTELPDGAGDFRLLDRKTVDVLNKLPERARFNKGLYAWIGFKSIGVPFDVAPRLDGHSRWRMRKLLSFALDGIASFTTVPLRVWSWLGLFISAMAFTYSVVFLFKTMVWGVDVPGYPSLIISVMFFSGVQLISLGVIGEYLGRVYEEVKGRPLYIVAERVGLDEAARSSAQPSAEPSDRQLAN